jgi:hypothetical protein
MSVFDVTELGATKSHADSITTGERGISEVKDRESSNDDAAWIAMMRNQHAVPTRRGVIWRVTQSVQRTDLRRKEVAEADRTAFLKMLRRRFEKRSDALFWSIVVLTLSAAVLIPLLGFWPGNLTATAISICCAAFQMIFGNAGK